MIIKIDSSGRHSIDGGARAGNLRLATFDRDVTTNVRVDNFRNLWPVLKINSVPELVKPDLS
jgi:hypothetical protein